MKGIFHNKNNGLQEKPNRRLERLVPRDDGGRRKRSAVIHSCEGPPCCNGHEMTITELKQCDPEAQLGQAHAIVTTVTFDSCLQAVNVGMHVKLSFRCVSGFLSLLDLGSAFAAMRS